MFISRDFGRRLKQARKKAGLTMTQAGEKVYISQSVVSRYEKGESIPTIDRVLALANLYGVSIDWLCGIKEVERL